VGQNIGDHVGDTGVKNQLVDGVVGFGDVLAVAVGDFHDGARFDLDAVVGEGGIDGGHIERPHFSPTQHQAEAKAAGVVEGGDAEVVGCGERIGDGGKLQHLDSWNVQ